jgi:acyl-CoA thioesterase-1
MRTFLVTLLLCFFTLPVFAENSILVIGDSISAGYGITPKQGWVSLLQQRLIQQKYGYYVVNASMSGDTTSNGLARLPQALKDHHPQITIIELGGNDGLRGLQIPTIRNNLQRMIMLAKKSRSQVLLLGVRLPPNYGLLYTQRFQHIFTDLAAQNAVSVVPLFLKNVDDDSVLMQADGIHPTIKAQMIMLNNMWQVLEKMLER